MVWSICPLPHIKSLTPISEKLCIGLSLIPRKIRIFRPLINSNFSDYPSATSVLFSHGLRSKFILKWTQKSAVCYLNKGLSCPENKPNSGHSKITFFFTDCKIQHRHQKKDQCAIFRQSVVSWTDTWAGGQWSRRIVNGVHEVTRFSGHLPRFVLAWHSGGHGWAKWGRRNTYSQFPRTRGRSSLRCSQRERKTHCYEQKNVLMYLNKKKNI